MQGSILVVSITMVVQAPFLIVADNPFKSMSEITIKNIVFLRKWDSFILLCTSSYVAISETSHTNGHDVRFYGHAFRFSSPVCCRMLRFFVAWCEIPHHTHLTAANTPEERYRGIKYRCNASTFLAHHGEMGFRNGKRNQRRRDSIAPQTKGGLSIASISALPRI